VTKIKLLTKRNCHLAFAVFFVVLAVGIALVPYNPMQSDLADATANYVWTGYYSKGVNHVSWEQWSTDWGDLRTQVVVVEHGGEFVVVNEKGPGLAIMLVPFRLAGIEFLFGPMMMAFAALGTYLLGRRIAGWKVGLAASAIVVANVTVLVMWQRYYWTDAATMHLLVLALALFVEAFYLLNGRTLDPREGGSRPSRGDLLLGLGLGTLAGLSFGAAISTRYAVALTGIGLNGFLLVFYLIKLWPDLRKADIRRALSRSKGLVTALVFLLGLAVVLVPLTQYNSEYFGGPFKSGYDATLIFKFNNSTQELEPRNTSTVWSSDLGGMVSTAFGNFFKLLPTLISRMPAMLLAPIGIWLLRKKGIWLALLLPWIIVGLGTYLALEWVDMYARLPAENVWEPRYFMPVLPAIAILGAVALGRLSEMQFGARVERDEAVDVSGKLVALAIVGAIMLWGLAPAVGNIAQIGDGQRTPGGGQGPGGGQDPPGGTQTLNVTTDQLLQDPQRYEESTVRLARATVVDSALNSIRVRSPGSALNGTVLVRFDMWPPGTIPSLLAGNEVEVSGRFVKLPSGGHAIMVKYGTQDYVRVASQTP
jgi:hypothetical protein